MTAGNGPRSLAALPKAHLHLHFTGSMRHRTLLELAMRDGLALPEALRDDWPPHLSATDERGWFRFQRLYDTARSVLRTENDVRRIIHEAAADDASEGSHWLEMQVDPSGYAHRFGGITAFLELVLDAAAEASQTIGIGVGIIVAANRTRHPLDARILARLAARYAGHGVVGFGLSNDERRGVTEEFTAAFTIAGRAGLALVPHGGELLGAESVRNCLTHLRADRIGHGIRACEDPELMTEIATRGITLEVCPASNVSLGVYADLASVPLPHMVEAGVPIALGADDPLLFGTRLIDQYTYARTVHGFSDHILAGMARSSINGSCAPSAVKTTALVGIDQWESAG